MSLYKNLILEVTRCTPEEAPGVEQLMRDDNGGTLDHLARTRFTREARKALKVYRSPAWQAFIAELRR